MNRNLQTMTKDDFIEYARRYHEEYGFCEVSPCPIHEHRCYGKSYWGVEEWETPEQHKERRAKAFLDAIQAAYN